MVAYGLIYITNVGDFVSKLISIVTPSYNSEEFINQTYLSIKNQTYINWEWLVTDDCSTDGTLKLLRGFSKNDSRVKVFVNVSNSGAAVSRNNSLDNATGEYIAFIDSDDLWMPEKLSVQLKYMMGDSLSFTFTAYQLISEGGQELGKTVDTFITGGVSYEDMLKKKATLGCSTVMLERCAFNDLKMPLIRTGQDYALWLKLLKTGQVAFVVNTVLTSYRISPNSISRNKVKKACRQWQIYREIEGLSLMHAIVSFGFYAYRAVFKR